MEEDNPSGAEDNAGATDNSGGGETEAGVAAAAVASQAIAGFGAQLAAQAFTPQVIKLNTVEDIYAEGLLAS